MEKEIKGITYIKNFIDKPYELFHFLQNNVHWDERMVTRKTASFGKAYNYSQISYPYQEFSDELYKIANSIHKCLHFLPNNCLINYYLDGNSKMGFHSDQTDILFENTGVAIVSIGETRILKFRKIADKATTIEYTLTPGSLLYMTNEIQNTWQHSIPKSDTKLGRISLTFRKIK